MNLHQDNICILSLLPFTVWNKVSKLTHLLTPTVFDLCDISDHDVGHGQLYHLATADHLEFLLLLDAVLQPTELLLLRPVVEGRDEHHTHHRQQDGHALDPAGFRLAIVLYPARRCATGCGFRESWGGVINLQALTCFSYMLKQCTEVFWHRCNQSSRSMNGCDYVGRVCVNVGGKKCGCAISLQTCNESNIKDSSVKKKMNSWNEPFFDSFTLLQMEALSSPGCAPTDWSTFENEKRPIPSPPRLASCNIVGAIVLYTPGRLSPVGRFTLNTHTHTHTK